MKITPEDYAILEKAIKPMMYKINRSGITAMRWRWDCLYRCGLKIGDGIGMPGDLNLYAYMDDTHIDTALKRITGTV